MATQRAPPGPEPVLYSMGMSHYCIAAERMLAFKGVRYRRVPVPYHDKQQLIRETGQDYVPALKVGDDVVAWDALPRSIEARWPDPPMYPLNREAVAEAVAQWAHNVLEEKVWRLSVTRIGPTFSDARERWVFEELQSRVRGSFDLLDHRRDEFRSDLAPALDLLDRAVDGREWLFDTPSIADFSTFGALAPLSLAGEPIPTKFHNLRRWHDAIASDRYDDPRRSDRPKGPGASGRR